MLYRTEIVQHIFQHLRRRTLQRVTVTATAGCVERVDITGSDLQTGELGWHLLNIVGRLGIVDLDLASRSGPAPKNAPGHVVVSFVFVGDETIREHPLRLDHTDTPAKPPRSGKHIVAKFITVADHRQVHCEIFKRVVPCIGHQVVYAVRSVGAWPAAIGTLVDFQKDPVIT